MNYAEALRMGTFGNISVSEKARKNQMPGGSLADFD
jgi:hypothetical protein